MADSISLNISTASGCRFEKTVSYVNVPTDFGSLGILHGHAPMLCSVAAGRVKFTCVDKTPGSVLVGGGIATVADNEVLLLVSEITEE